MNRIKYLLAKPAIWLACGGVLGATGLLITQNSATKANAAETTMSAKSFQPLEALDKLYADLVDKIKPSVVHISTDVKREGKKKAQNGYYQRPVGSGSGVIIRADGWIVTNDHVVDGVDKVTVKLNDGRELVGTVRHANDPQVDLALVKVEQNNLTPIAFADSSQVRVGQGVVVAGSPTGLFNSVSFGRVAALSRASLAGSPDDPNNVRAYFDLLQLDAIVLPGNSGGLCANMRGELIGINSAKIPSGDGIGFALKGNFVKKVVDILINKGKISRSYLGVDPVDLEEYQLKDMKISHGAQLNEVVKDGPAAQAGLQAKDIVTKIDGEVIRSQQDVRNVALFNPPGTKLSATYIRDGKEKTTTVTTAKMPKAYAAKRQPVQPQYQQFPGFFPPFFRDFFGPGFGGGFYGPQYGGPQNYQGQPEPEEEDVPEQEQAPAPAPAPESKNGPVSLGATVNELNKEMRQKYSIPADVKGALITGVKEDSLAKKIGLKPGDVVLQLGKKKISDWKELKSEISKVKPGTTLSLSYARYGKGSIMQSTVPVTFGGSSSAKGASAMRKSFNRIFAPAA